MGIPRQAAQNAISTTPTPVLLMRVVYNVGVS